MSAAASHVLAPEPSLGEAYAVCERLARGHYENFPVLSWFVPAPMRPAMAAVYAFCRGVDDLGDEGAPERRLALLDEWERHTRAAFGTEAGAAALPPPFLALADTARRHGLDAAPFLALIEANRMDQRLSRYESFDALVHYCRHSADPVGRIVLRLFGHREERLDRLSDRVCTALQLANFWQDAGLDWRERGRLYIPQEDLRRFGVAEEQIARGEVNAAWRGLMRFEIGRTRALFHEGEPLVEAVSPALRDALRLFIRGGRAALRSVERADYDVFRRRPSVPKLQKLFWMSGLALRRAWRGLAGGEA